MTTRTRVGSHHIALPDVIRSVPGAAPFDPAAYSLMKHGGRSEADRFAGELYLALRDDEVAAAALTDDRPPIFLVAYRAVVPACFHLSEGVLARTNLERGRLGLAPGVLAKVDKDSVTTTDYATATAEDRRRELATIGFTLPLVDLCSANAVVVDDIRVTGAAEAVMTSLLEPVRLARLVLGYVVTVDPTYADGHPQVEQELNSAAVRSILDLVDPVRGGNIAPTIRFLKLVLGSEPSTLREFLNRVGTAVARRLLDEAITGGPAFVTARQPGVDLLRSYLAGEDG